MRFTKLPHKKLTQLYKSHLPKKLARVNHLLLDAHSPVSLSLPLELATSFLDYVLNNNSRHSFIINSTLDLEEKGYHKIMIPGSNHFERNFNYLAAHLSEVHGLKTMGDQKTLSFVHKNLEQGVFYIEDSRPYLEKLYSPLLPSQNIVNTFLKLPTQSFYLKSYESVHRRVVYANESKDVKEFTHKLVITKDFKREEIEAFRNIPHLTNEGKSLDGIGLAFSKKSPINKSGLYTPVFSHTTQVSLLIQITKEVYKHLTRTVLMDDFTLDGQILNGNAFVLSLFPFLPDCL
ncbi:MAG: hypothetical protein K2Q34_06390 [Alphaproteobacteria bacterium]|nr:hypothetical protein [Alphaproteobacteria bacterium]